MNPQVEDRRKHLNIIEVLVALCRDFGKNPFGGTVDVRKHNMVVLRDMYESACRRMSLNVKSRATFYRYCDQVKAAEKAAMKRQ